MYKRQCPSGAAAAKGREKEELNKCAHDKKTKKKNKTDSQHIINITKRRSILSKMLLI